MCPESRFLLQFGGESVPTTETDYEEIEVSEEQIIAILKEHESCVSTADIAASMGFLDRQTIAEQSARGNSATFYKWQAKFRALEVSDARKLKALEDENAKSKRRLAEQMLDNSMLKGPPWVITHPPLALKALA